MTGVHSTAAYKDLIKKIEQLNKFLFYALFSTIFLNFFLAGPFSFIRYYIFGMEENSFFTFIPSWFVFTVKRHVSMIKNQNIKRISIKLRYPFDWKTPLGYLVVWLAQYAGAASMTIFILQFLNFVFGSCWLFNFIAEDITQDIAGFNFIVRTTSDGDRTGLTKHFCNIVQIYSDVKE